MASENPQDLNSTDAVVEDATSPAKKPAKRAAKKATKKAVKAAAPETPAQPDATEAVAVPAPKRKRASKKVAVVETSVEPLPEEDEDGQTAEASAQDAEDASVAAPSFGFGLLFQAAEPVVAAPRRRGRPAPSVLAEVEAEVEVEVEVEELTEPAEEAATDDDADTAEDAGRRRRRRGGRGRRARSAEDEAGEEGDSASGDESERGASEDDEESTSSRRRRRRRRSGSAVEGEDPPGTVTRVREPRASRDEPTALKGSTRLEAKKQRRREGREAGRRRTVLSEAEFLARREAVERTMVVRGRDDRTQIAVLEDGVLVEHYVSRATTTSMAGNVYLGRVQNVLPSMEAAFVDIGKGRNAVLYAGEVNWDAAGLEINQAKRIENALSSGDTVLVQVTKDPIGHKGARLTSQISLPGRFLVYVPEGSMTGISRKLPDTERARLKAILRDVLPDSAGVIVRTAAEGASEEELRADVERLTKTWDAIKRKAEAATKKKSGSGGAPLLLHGEPDLTVRVIRDVFTEDFTSLVVSGEQAWSEVSGYVEDVAPDLAGRLSRWTSEGDVFAQYRVDEAIAKAMDRKVWLPSGGSLVIDRTEAMTVVDVNTGKFVGSGGNLEETVTKNNLEAAEEIVRQLRLRDIGGIIVIDFIDMVLESNRDLVVRRLLECLGRDRTKHQVAEVTSLGLVQMTRKRVGSGLIEVFSETCEHCNGRGIVIHTEPVERSAESAPAASESAANRSSRRRGKAQPVEEPAKANGPTAAQIAAAAHAAAVRRMHGEEGELGDLGELPDASTVGVLEAELDVVVVEADVVALPDSVDAAEAEPAPARRGRRKRGRVVAPAGPPRASHSEDPSPADG